MTNLFKYFYELRSNDVLDIKDVGNVELTAFNDDYMLFCLSIKTELGVCLVKQFGPLNADTKEIENNFVYSRKTFQYNEKKLCSIIDKFLNDTKYNITQAIEVDSVQEFIPKEL